jgi:hypothetical protein
MPLLDIPRVLAIRAAEEDDHRAGFAFQIDGFCDAVTLRAAMHAYGIDGIDSHGAELWGN